MQSIKRSSINLYNTTAPIRRKSGRLLTRYFKGVGVINKNWIMMQKNYSAEIIPFKEFMDAQTAVQKNYPLFQYELVSYNIKSKELRFHMCPDFDTEITPTITGTLIYSPKHKKIKYDDTTSTIEHKWRLVKDDYTGFNVQDSYNISKCEEEI